MSSDVGQDKTLGSSRQVRQMNIQREDENTMNDTVRVQRPTRGIDDQDQLLVCSNSLDKKFLSFLTSADVNEVFSDQ